MNSIAVKSQTGTDITAAFGIGLIANHPLRYCRVHYGTMALDELVDYVLSQSDVKLDELTIETVLDAEMDYLMEKGIAGYLD